VTTPKALDLSAKILKTLTKLLKFSIFFIFSSCLATVA